MVENKTKLFIIMMMIMTYLGIITLLALVAAIQVLPRLVDSADGPPTYDVGVVGETINYILEEV